MSIEHIIGALWDMPKTLSKILKGKIHADVYEVPVVGNTVVISPGQERIYDPEKLRKYRQQIIEEEIDIMYDTTDKEYVL